MGVLVGGGVGVGVAVGIGVSDARAPGDEAAATAAVLSGRVAGGPARDMTWQAVNVTAASSTTPYRLK